MAIIKCPHCGNMTSDQSRRCSNCDSEINRDAVVCIKCGSYNVIDDTDNYFAAKQRKGFLSVILSIFIVPFFNSKVVSDTLAESLGSEMANVPFNKRSLNKYGKAVYLCQVCKSHFVAPKQDASEKK